jgi:hypothetical protein
MQSFAKNFEREQEEIRSFKMTQIVRRAMALQARAKIKPTSMNPDLLTMSKMRGGIKSYAEFLRDTLRENPQERILADLRSGKRIDEQDVIQLEAKNSPAAQVTRRMYEDQKNNRPLEQRDRTELDVISARIARGGGNNTESQPLELYWPSS